MDPRQGKELKRASKTKGFTWNAAILVVVSARYSKGWIQGGAKIVRGRASPFTKSSFRPNVHSNILMYCWQHMHLFESCHSGCLFFWLNCLLLVIRWAIKGPWASSFSFSSATAERILSKLDRKQVLNVQTTGFVWSQSLPLGGL